MPSKPSRPRLASPRSRLKTRLAAEQAAQGALASTGSERWLSFEISRTEQDSFRQEKCGRPGEQTCSRKTTNTIHAHLRRQRWEVAYDAATDGCFPLVGNDHQLTDPELKSPSRIEGLACCTFIALLAQGLIERELRAAITPHAVSELALYHEGRASQAPTAARVCDLFAAAARQHLTSQNAGTVQIFEPELNDLQRQALNLLGVPQINRHSATSHYQPARPPPRASGVQADLIAGGREGPRDLLAPLLTEVEAQLAGWPEALGPVGPEGGTGAGLCDRAEHVLLEEAAVTGHFPTTHATISHRDLAPLPFRDLVARRHAPTLAIKAR